MAIVTVEVSDEEFVVQVETPVYVVVVDTAVRQVRGD